MKNNILISLVLLLLTACSQKTPDVKAHLTVKTPIKSEVLNKVPKDFIPEHIRKSKIEVVKHY